MDFDSPGIGKLFRAIEFETSQALSGTQAVTFAYRLDQNASYTNLTTIQIGPRNFVAFFGPGIKGTEVQPQITLTADATAGAPTVTSVSVIADLGRILDYTVSCRRDQQARSQDNAAISAQPYSGQELAANLMNIRNIGGGRCYAYIPDPTAASGVSAIQARLVDYKRTAPQGGATGFRDVNGEWDMECDVSLTLAESFDP